MNCYWQYWQFHLIHWQSKCICIGKEPSPSSGIEAYRHSISFHSIRIAQNGTLKLVYIPSEQNVVDVLQSQWSERNWNIFSITLAEDMINNCVHGSWMIFFYYSMYCICVICFSIGEQFQQFCVGLTSWICHRFSDRIFALLYYCSHVDHMELVRTQSQNDVSQTDIWDWCVFLELIKFQNNNSVVIAL